MYSRFLAIGVLLVSMAAPALAAPSPSPSPSPSDVAKIEAPALYWIDAYNAHRTPLPQGVFTDDVAITDQFAPYHWVGTSGLRDWSSHIDNSLQKDAAAKYHVVVGSLTGLIVARDGNEATFYLPATLTYLVDGKLTEDRALWQFVVVRSGDKWKIAGDVWVRTYHGPAHS